MGQNGETIKVLGAVGFQNGLFRFFSGDYFIEDFWSSIPNYCCFFYYATVSNATWFYIGYREGENTGACLALAYRDNIQNKIGVKKTAWTWQPLMSS